MRKEIEKLLNSDMTAYAIGKGAGVPVQVVQRLKSGERTLDRLALMTAEKLYEYAKKVETEGKK